MAGLRVVILLPMLLALILAVGAHKNHRLHARNDDDHSHNRPPNRPCSTNPDSLDYSPVCATPKSTTISESTEEVDDTLTSNTESTTSSTTSLERAHWCRFSNGSYLSMGALFMHATCSLCECTRSRLIQCRTLQCMPTYCVDNQMPKRPDGECCTKCAYEPKSDACVYKNMSYPHGVILKSVEDKMQCWCQLGKIECRNYIVSLGGNLINNGVAIYIIVVVLIIVLVFGLLLCIGCTVGFYYYYKRHQQTFQQAYNEYVHSAGWQPMNDGEQAIVDPTTEDKHIEAENNQFSTGVDEGVPPPYAAYNGAYTSEQEQEQK